jgi:hypothetical protein
MKQITNQNTNSQKLNLEVIAYKLDDIQNDIEEIKKKLDGSVATKEWCMAEFAPTRKIVNGILVTFGTAIVLAVAAFVVGGGLK